MVKGVLFDFDGTIVDSEKNRFVCLNLILKEYNLKISEQDWHLRYKRVNSHYIIKEFLEKGNLGLDVDEIYLKYYNLREEYTAKNGVEVIEGFFEFYEFLTENKIKMIICSGGKREHLIYDMKLANLPKIEFLGREDYANIKPAPDCYIKGCEILGFQKNEVVCFDDSFNGILAAKNANMRIYAINSFEDEISKLEPDFLIRNYNEIDFEEFLRL